MRQGWFWRRVAGEACRGAAWARGKSRQGRRVKDRPVTERTGKSWQARRVASAQGKERHEWRVMAGGARQSRVRHPLAGPGRLGGSCWSRIGPTRRGRLGEATVVWCGKIRQGRHGKPCTGDSWLGGQVKSRWASQVEARQARNGMFGTSWQAGWGVVYQGTARSGTAWQAGHGQLG